VVPDLLSHAAMSSPRCRVLHLAVAVAVLTACEDELPTCEDAALPSRAELRCESEFLAQASRPLDASLPGARTIKTVIDRALQEAVHFMDTTTYPLHSTFAVEHLGFQPGSPFVDQYFLPQRRFLLGAVTHYEEPDIWAYELAPYDTASPEMIRQAFQRLSSAAYFGDRLRFHPTSQEQLERAAELSELVPVVTTEEIYAGTSYQPLNLGETYAQVHVLTAEELTTTYVGPRELVVLDRVPNDLSIVAAVITEEFQTPLSHVNVLSQQRGTPNMGLRGASAALGAFQGQWVRLEVRPFDWSVAPATPEEAEEWWSAHRPTPARIPAPDYSVTGILDIDAVGLADISAVGGKAAHYGELRDIPQDVRVRDALAIPVFYYRQFLEQNGFISEIAAMLQDPAFRGDGNVRRNRLKTLRKRMEGAPLDLSFLATLEARLQADFPDTRMKFRSSTNAEDLAIHSGAGLYDSKAGQVGDPEDPVANALRKVWASTWNFAAFEEREYAGIDQAQVAMAILVNPSYQDEVANGVAITANLYDPAPGGEDAFYVNAQVGEASVVQPEPSVRADQLMYYHSHPGNPATYYQHSSLVGPGQTVLSRAELFELGTALAALRQHFASRYEPPAPYAHLPMDVEWKLATDEQGVSHIWIKQARPYPGRGH
jgi:pyruvate, water dikinase